MNAKPVSDNAAIRSEKRAMRNQMSSMQQFNNAADIASVVCKQPVFRNSKRVACYLANDGEIDPEYIIQTAWEMRKQVYLPVLSPLQNKLYFALFENSCEMHINRFGILEPAVSPATWIQPRQLDLMLLPLVAFDEAGNRLGMGGGFYDRTLAYLSTRQHARNPKLIGLAHELQLTESIQVNSWDITLDMIATENRVIKVKS